MEKIHRETLRETNQALVRTGESIVRSEQAALEAEAIGTGVISELGVQREALVRARDRLVDTDLHVSRSRRMIQAIRRRVFYNKLFLIMIIVIESMTLSVMLYLKIFKKR
ncbi:vesicle transport through interaction with t-SNAREs homolog 1B-like [Diaphorina citri]|jgi:Snare region anchored in the vesicle membrane C-terminus.|uniref:Vesicle transport through interaction with t-SNAREs homolog 1B-like n=1 Tax=Diaphorina citri TaxID=121845 RepID=A0A1S3DL48_DIACI|nr:vesicle transport through interaction with t-SNAREs homolog 1B-like [Diaphorina citri]XP_008483219.1 vesicle transport through interaction with t-SNAREs homolog 1B-like [Diaphorina citri]KAI5706458.1 hypothetical protein M8J75_008322 [Diaphorina citri]KAI5741784.1 hypothetical protein M8J76_017022 [Diaphorina citri]KAI5748350.1 hypothetical protein M8J77_024621 [Diaphorina citri]